jgi:Sec-independent protein translocase protein TatA
VCRFDGSRYERDRIAVTIPSVDLLVVLIIVLVVVVVWRGPKTLPLLGKAFGQGVREARKEIEDIKTDSSEDKDAKG